MEHTGESIEIEPEQSTPASSPFSDEIIAILYSLKDLRYMTSWLGNQQNLLSTAEGNLVSSIELLENVEAAASDGFGDESVAFRSLGMHARSI